jgi:hypothetical protein
LQLTKRKQWICIDENGAFCRPNGSYAGVHQAWTWSRYMATRRSDYNHAFVIGRGIGVWVFSGHEIFDLVAPTIHHQVLHAEKVKNGDIRVFTRYARTLKSFEVHSGDYGVKYYAKGQCMELTNEKVEIEPIRKPSDDKSKAQKLEEIAKSGNRLEVLQALRNELAKQVDNVSVNARDKATIAKQLMEIMKQIDDIEQAKQSEIDENPLNEIMKEYAKKVIDNVKKPTRSSKKTATKN